MVKFEFHGILWLLRQFCSRSLQRRVRGSNKGGVVKIFARASRAVI